MQFASCKVEERLVSVDELLNADEVFCTGTAVVVSPVGSITYLGERWQFSYALQVYLVFHMHVPWTSRLPFLRNTVKHIFLCKASFPVLAIAPRCYCWNSRWCNSSKFHHRSRTWRTYDMIVVLCCWFVENIQFSRESHSVSMLDSEIPWPSFAG